MKKNLNYWIQRVTLAMLCLSLLSQTLHAKFFLIQPTQKTDSICLCGSQKEIDSTLKILNDYPDLLRSKVLVLQILSDERTISKSEQAAIMKVLDLKEWNIKTVKRRIRWLKIRGATWAVGGVAVGVAVILLRQP
jgi:hypothetical protein